MRRWTLGFSFLMLGKLQCCQHSNIYCQTKDSMLLWMWCVCASALGRMHIRCVWDGSRGALLHCVFSLVAFQCSDWRALPVVDNGMWTRCTQAVVNRSKCILHKWNMMGWGWPEEGVTTNFCAVSSRGRNQIHRALARSCQNWGEGGQWG